MQTNIALFSPKNPQRIPNASNGVTTGEFSHRCEINLCAEVLRNSGGAWEREGDLQNKGGYLQTQGKWIKRERPQNPRESHQIQQISWRERNQVCITNYFIRKHKAEEKKEFEGKEIEKIDEAILGIFSILLI